VASAEVEPAAPPSGPPPSDTFETSGGPLTITPIHHATVVFGFAKRTFLIDPWTKAPDGWLPKADVVLVTDIHQDHFDPEALAIVQKADTIVVAPAVVKEKFPVAKVLSNGESLDVHGVHVEAVPMYNTKRGPAPGKLFHDRGRGNGYVLRFGDKTVYVSGDTECTQEMKALTNVDVALVCMNLPYTMPPEEAAACVKAFQPKVVIPYHYRDSDLDVFKKALADVPTVAIRIRNFYVGEK
jgi:L-ascorbate metabolism protein UlaG (beta-lactamase superfamily)